MNQATPPRIWIVLSIGLAAIAGFGLLLAILGRGVGPTQPTFAPPTSTPPLPEEPHTPEQGSVTDDPAVASVNGRSIRRSLWMEAALLDLVMSGWAGQSAPTYDETLQRLIDEELVLQASPSEQEPTTGQIEAQIAAIEQACGVGDAAATAALEAVGLDRTALRRAVRRSLAVEAGLASLERQGYNTAVWLEKQRGSVGVLVLEGAATQVVSGVQVPIATLAVSPTAAPGTETPTPERPEVAPGFTLEQAAAATVTLSAQLAQGPVVLIFFQKCG